MADTLLELKNVSKYYTGAQSVVMGLSSVSLTFSRGEFVAVTGESGSGKSTLAHVLGGILPYESGEMTLSGKPTSHYGGLDWERYRRDNVSFISQSYGILPGATVMRNVMSALILVGMEKAAAKEAAGDILRRVDLWELRNRRAAKLSSGQKQRLSIARALAKPAPILIADEPTGNLDAENSAKIIGLLAGAARERLVILVTHEFDEARDLATRHIILQDGHIAADIPLRPALEPGPVPAAETKKRRMLSPYVARLQCLSRPVWTAIMAAFFAITAFAVFAFLGVFISSIDDTFTRVYDPSAFKNGDPTRIVVLSQDMGALTQEDYAAFLSIPHVEAVEPWANVADAQYAYREGVDFDAVYTQESKLDITGTSVNSWIEVRYVMRDDAPFIRTVPVLRDGETFLSEGSFPENMYEVVCGDGEHRIGDLIDVYLIDGRTMNMIGRSYLQMTFKVVGLTDWGDGLFFHDDLGRFFRQGYAQAVSVNEKDHGLMYLPNNPYAVCPDESQYETWKRQNIAEAGHFVGSYDVFRGLLALYTDQSLGWKYNTIEELYALTGQYTFRSDDADENGNYRQVSLLPTAYTRYFALEDELAFLFQYSSLAGPRTMLVTYEDFDVLCWNTRDEAGLTISDYAYTDRVLKALDEMGYPAISVYRQGATEVNPELAAERSQTLRICLLALLVAAALQVVVLRAMFSVENESFKLLGNIGLTGRTAKRSVLLQIAFFTVLGQLLGAAGIWACYAAGVQKIVDMLKYLPAAYLAILSATHMALSAVAAAWVIRALSRQVYPLGTVQHDIDLDDAQEVAA